MSASDSKGSLLWRMTRAGALVLGFGVVLLFAAWQGVILVAGLAFVFGGVKAVLWALGIIIVVMMVFVSDTAADEFDLSAPVAFISGPLLAASCYGAYHLIPFVLSSSAVWWQWLVGHFAG
jgi:hypothetical protein